MRHIFLILSFSLFLAESITQAQQIIVRDIFHLENDLAARTSPRQSPDSSFCALLRINLPTASMIRFEGIVGESHYSPGEYQIYVPAHTSQILFNVPGY